MEESDVEKNKRIDTVVGIVIASIIGFLVNLFASLYYALFVVRSTSWAAVNHQQVYVMILAFLGLVGFLQFFIDDYKNNIEINSNLFKRYIKYFFYEFTAGKFIRWFLGIYLLLTLLGFLFGIYVVFAQTWGYLLTTLVSVGIIAAIYFKMRGKRVSK